MATITVTAAEVASRFINKYKSVGMRANKSELKKCAIIAIDEILLSGVLIGSDTANEWRMFFRSVIKEIKNYDENDGWKTTFPEK